MFLTLVWFSPQKKKKKNFSLGLKEQHFSLNNSLYVKKNSS